MPSRDVNRNKRNKRNNCFLREKGAAIYIYIISIIYD